MVVLCEFGKSKSASSLVSLPVCTEDVDTEIARTVNELEPPDASIVPESISIKILLLLVLVPKTSETACPNEFRCIPSTPLVPVLVLSTAVTNNKALCPAPFGLCLFNNIAGIRLVVIASASANGSALNTLVISNTLPKEDVIIVVALVSVLESENARIAEVKLAGQISASISTDVRKVLKPFIVVSAIKYRKLASGEKFRRLFKINGILGLDDATDVEERSGADAKSGGSLLACR